MTGHEKQSHALGCSVKLLLPCQELLRGYHASAEDHIHAAHERQQALVTSEAITMQLDALVSLSQLPEGTQPSDFPRPARGTERRVSRSAEEHDQQFGCH
jgi:hypothetical protein